MFRSVLSLRPLTACVCGLVAFATLGACTPEAQAPRAAPTFAAGPSYSYNRQLLTRGLRQGGLTQSEPGLIDATYFMRCSGESAYKAASAKIATTRSILEPVGPSIMRESLRREANAVSQPLGCTVTQVELRAGNRSRAAIADWLLHNPQAMAELAKL